MKKVINENDLKNLFNKPYGVNSPTQKKWSEFYSQNVVFIDPTQKTEGLDSYIKAQEKLINRCEDVFLETQKISISNIFGFVEWRMGLKILGKEFIYEGVTRLTFEENGLIKEHRDYFDFCSSTFGPVPILGPFIRWLYARFIA